MGPMQIVYMLLVFFGILEHVTAHLSATPIDEVGTRVQGGTLFWIGLILLIVSVPVKIFG